MRTCLNLLAFTLAFTGSITCAAQTAPTSPTLAKIHAAHTLNCGVDFEEAEYSTEDAHGNHSRFDLDLCKAIAVAALGPDARFNAVPFRDERDALVGLTSGEIDVLATASVNYHDTATLGLGFATPIFHDHQGFLVNKASGIHSAHDLAGKRSAFSAVLRLSCSFRRLWPARASPGCLFRFRKKVRWKPPSSPETAPPSLPTVSQLAYERLAFQLHPGAAYDILSGHCRSGPPRARLPRSMTGNGPISCTWTVEALLLATQKPWRDYSGERA